MSFNIINKSNVGERAFNIIRDYLFDDFQIVDEEYLKHSECSCTLLSVVNIDTALDISERLKMACIDIGVLAALPILAMVGHWMASTSRTYNDGVDINSICEIERASRVTETVVVTSWKPISHVNQETNSPQKQ